MMRTETARWWRQANADLETAEVLLRGQRFYAVSYFVQQAVEKGLKALYIERTGTLARRTHDLLYLGREVSVPPEVQGDLTTLNSAVETTRYPEPDEGTVPVDETTEADAIGDLETGRRVLTWIEQRLDSASSQA